MRTGPAILFHTLHQLALSLWLGGLLTVGAVTAPAVFGTARRAGDTRWGMPLFNFAGEALGEAFRRLNYVVVVAGALALVGGLAYAQLAGLCRVRRAVRAALTAAAWAVALWLTFGLYPAMLAARAAGRMEVFDSMHHQYTHAAQVQVLLLLTVLVLTAFLDLDRAPQHAGDRKRR